MSYKLGNFVFVNMDTISSDSMCFMDLGLETKDSCDYYFDNETENKWESTHSPIYYLN